MTARAPTALELRAIAEAQPVLKRYGITPNPAAVGELVQAILGTLREPTREAIDALTTDTYPSDWRAGKALQERLGGDVVRANTEVETMAGRWLSAIDKISPPGQIELVTSRPRGRQTKA